MRSARLRSIFILGFIVWLFAPLPSAHTEPKSPADRDNLTLSTWSVNNHRFIAAHGRRALIEGYAAEGLEIWAYPFQIVNSYRLAFRLKGAAKEIDGQRLLSRVDYSPDCITRTYRGPGFVIREELFVPLNQSGGILTYATEGKQVDIEVQATPVMNLMWPASLSGQSISWDSELSAYILSEPEHGFISVLGSPNIVAHDVAVSRLLQTDGGQIKFTLRPGATGTATVFFALNQPNESDHGATLRALIQNGESLHEEAAAHYREFRKHVLKVQTPDANVNQAIEWSEIALDQAWVCNTDLGCGFVAGYGPSQAPRRPQYAWFFAGDGMVAAEAALAAGDATHSREELEFILHYQDRKSGMIWHELSQSASLIDWTGKYPYMFVHVDVTFQFLAAVAHYVTVTGDTKFARDHWQALDAAYHYCLSLIDPATALPRIPDDKEGGNEQDRMSEDLGLSMSWVEASSAFAMLANITGHQHLAEEAQRSSQRGRDSIPARYWNSRDSFWISGYNAAGRPMTDRRSGPSSALTMHLFNADQDQMLLDRLASSSFQTDWGTRGVSDDSPSYAPDSYATGSVWPVGTGSLAAAFWSEHRPATALALWNSLLRLSAFDSLGHIHEVFAGNAYHPQGQSVPEQTWSSAGFLNSTIHGLLGLQIDSLASQLTFAPSPLGSWNDLSVSNIPLAGRSVSLRLHRTPNSLSLQIENSGSPFQLKFTPNLPLGAEILNARLNDSPIDATIGNFPQQTVAQVALTAPHGTSRLMLAVKGGVSIIPDEYFPEAGQPSAGIRIVDLRLSGRKLTFVVDVPTGRSSRLNLQSAWKLVSQGNTSLQLIGPRLYRLNFPPDSTLSAHYHQLHAEVAINP